MFTRKGLPQVVRHFINSFIFCFGISPTDSYFTFPLQSSRPPSQLWKPLLWLQQRWGELCALHQDLWLAQSRSLLPGITSLLIAFLIWKRLSLSLQQLQAFHTTRAPCGICTSVGLPKPAFLCCSLYQALTDALCYVSLQLLVKSGSRRVGNTLCHLLWWGV